MASKFNKMYRSIINEMNDDIMRQMGFGEQVDMVHKGICPSCKTPVNPEDFRDELSKKEFKISGLCQKCQDEIFGAPEDNEYMTDEEECEGCSEDEMCDGQEECDDQEQCEGQEECDDQEEDEFLDEGSEEKEKDPSEEL